MSSRPTYALMVKDAVLEGPKGTSVAGVKKHLHEKFDVDLTSSRVKASIERAMRTCLEEGELIWHANKPNGKLQLSKGAGEDIKAADLQPCVVGSKKTKKHQVGPAKAKAAPTKTWKKSTAPKPAPTKKKTPAKASATKTKAAERKETPSEKSASGSAPETESEADTERSRASPPVSAVTKARKDPTVKIPSAKKGTPKKHK